jgi:perosamine synthetase
MIPVNEPVVSAGRELEYVSECVQTGWVSSAGRFVQEFEDGWAQYCGRRYGISVSNGTAALTVAVACLNLEPGDEVIMPSFTIISCALAIIANGGLPVLVDSDPQTWCMDPTRVEEKITSRTRALILVHTYGHPVDVDALVQLADKYGLKIIEDAAEAHGAEYLCGRNTENPTWRRCGSFGALSTFSFYANKPITTGEGGMVLTDDPELDRKARSLRNLCFQADRRFHHEDQGWNFRLTNLQAALGLAQLERINEIVARKRRIGRDYSDRLSNVAKLSLPAKASWARNVYWMYGVVLADDSGMNNTELACKLRERGVDTRPFFLGMHEQPVFQKRGLFLGDRYPVTEKLARQGLYLPSGLALTDDQLDEVCAAVREVLE